MTDIGYVEPPIIPDSAVYKHVSKDESGANNHEATAAIQYGNNTMAVSSENGETSSSGTIAIEVAEVVNLMGGDVASDGSRMDLTNTDAGSTLSVQSTEEGYLSVGNAESEGSIGIENEDGTFFASTGRSSSSRKGYSSGTSSESRNSLNASTAKSEGDSAESDETLGLASVDWLTSNIVQQEEDKKKKKEDEEDKDKSEEGDGRESKAAITYNDVA